MRRPSFYTFFPSVVQPLASVPRLQEAVYHKHTSVRALQYTRSLYSFTPLQNHFSPIPLFCQVWPSGIVHDVVITVDQRDACVFEQGVSVRPPCCPWVLKNLWRCAAEISAWKRLNKGARWLKKRCHSSAQGCADSNLNQALLDLMINNHSQVFVSLIETINHFLVCSCPLLYIANIRSVEDEKCPVFYTKLFWVLRVLQLRG